MFYAIIHGLKGSDQSPFLHLTTDKDLHDKYVKHLNDDILAGGDGIMVWEGSIDNVDFQRFWVMPFNK